VLLCYPLLLKLARLYTHWQSLELLSASSTYHHIPNVKKYPVTDFLSSLWAARSASTHPTNGKFPFLFWILAWNLLSFSGTAVCAWLLPNSAKCNRKHTWQYKTANWISGLALLDVTKLLLLAYRVHSFSISPCSLSSPLCLLPPSCKLEQ